MHGVRLEIWKNPDWDRVCIKCTKRMGGKTYAYTLRDGKVMRWEVAEAMIRPMTIVNYGNPLDLGILYEKAVTDETPEEARAFLTSEGIEIRGGEII